MKRISLLLWTATIGTIATVSVGTAIAYEPHCHDANNKFLAKISKPHKLDHRPSKATLRKWKQYNDEMLRKLDFACEVMIDHKLDEDLLGGNGLLGGGVISDVALLPDNESLVQLETEAVGVTGLIPEREYPVYENASTSIPDDGSYGPYPSFPGWFGGGGYLGSIGSGSNLGNNPPPPPIAPTPEPLPFALVMIGAAFIVVRRRK
jgi:hypothetical protein